MQSHSQIQVRWNGEVDDQEELNHEVRDSLSVVSSCFHHLNTDTITILHERHL